VRKEKASKEGKEGEKAFLKAKERREGGEDGNALSGERFELGAFWRPFNEVEDFSSNGRLEQRTS